MTVRMVTLGVNIDHVATLRQVRRAAVPDPVAAAAVCEAAGADGITVHLREDRRHIQDHDVERLRQSLATRLNLEMAVTDEMVRIACRLKPAAVCLVPEKRQELTTEGGLDVAGRKTAVTAAVHALKDAGIMVSLFIDPVEQQIAASAAAGADCVELHTGAYAAASEGNAPVVFPDLSSYKRLVTAAAQAQQCGLIVNAGHGLDYVNVQPVARIAGMHELNIGFAIIARAVLVGLERAVREMKAALA